MKYPGTLIELRSRCLEVGQPAQLRRGRSLAANRVSALPRDNPVRALQRARLDQGRIGACRQREKADPSVLDQYYIH